MVSFRKMKELPEGTVESVVCHLWAAGLRAGLREPAVLLSPSALSDPFTRTKGKRYFLTNLLA